MNTFTKDNMRERVVEAFPDDTVLHTVNRWLARGDGIAVYCHQDLSSNRLGELKLVSYGSAAAQLPTEKIEDEWALPPTRLPDIGGQINWAFQLVGVYHGEAL